MSEVIDDPSLSARFQARRAEIAATKEQDLSIADRLTRRAFAAPTITIDLGDEDDPIPVEMRIPVTAELEVLLTLEARLNAAKSAGEKAMISDEVVEVLAAICLDPSLDVAFWRSGLFDMSCIFSLVKGATEEAVERLQNARAFRQKAGGKGPARPVRGAR